MDLYSSVFNETGADRKPSVCAFGRSWREIYEAREAGAILGPDEYYIYGEEGIPYQVVTPPLGIIIAIFWFFFLVFFLFLFFFFFLNFLRIYI